MVREILVTGGAGYIGSHTVVQLLNADYIVVVFDNLSNSSPRVIERINRLTGKVCEFIEGDVRDRRALQIIFRQHNFDAVIHFAGLKAVGESEAKPLKYYDNNVSGSLILIDEMANAGVTTIVFSSSATVYGNPGYVQYCEDTPLVPVNVYGKSKLMRWDRIIRTVLRSSRIKIWSPISRSMGFLSIRITR